MEKQKTIISTKTLSITKVFLAVVNIVAVTSTLSVGMFAYFGFPNENASQSSLAPGWPQVISIDSTWASKIYEAVMTDLENDGKNEILTTYSLDVDESYLDAYTSGGIQKAGFPILINGAVYHHASVADFNNDGQKEILVGYQVANLTQEIAIFNLDGTPLSGWPVQINNLNKLFATPAIGDIDNDHDLELLFGSNKKLENNSWQGQVFAYHHDGTAVAGWPVTNGHWGPFYGTPALGDIDKDGYLEVIAGCYDGFLYAWQHDGTPISGWPVRLDIYDVITYQSPQIADLDNDGNLEIIQVTNNQGKIFVLDQAGNILQEMLPEVGSGIPNTPAIGDIDNDGDLEISLNVLEYIYLWHHDGTLFDGWPVFAGSFTTDNQLPVSNTLGDIDGDGNTDIVTASYNGVSTFDGSGNLIQQWLHNPEANNMLSSAFISDTDKDGKVELVYTYAYLTWPGNPGSYYVINVLDLASQYNKATVKWPMFQHDERHTGNYNIQCSEGTYYGECSVTKPQYCQNGQIINECKKCGCPALSTCRTDGSCLPDNSKSVSH